MICEGFMQETEIVAEPSALETEEFASTRE
jgi:hypothetical protein